MVASSISDHNFQQLWLKVQLKTCKSFLLGTVYRLPNTPISFLENLTETFSYGSFASIARTGYDITW